MAEYAAARVGGGQQRLVHTTTARCRRLPAYQLAFSGPPEARLSVCPYLVGEVNGSHALGRCAKSAIFEDQAGSARCVGGYELVSTALTCDRSSSASLAAALV
jgi:hypothetical protein